MAISYIEVIDILGFQRQMRKNNGDTKAGPLQNGDHFSDAFHLDFSPGINVLIGENGVGKTSLLKMIYAATQWSIERTEPGKTDKFSKFFSATLKDTDLLRNANDYKGGYAGYQVCNGEQVFTYSLSHNGFMNYENWLGLNIQSVFIPTTEMLSHSQGFLALNQKYKMPFDGTQVDIIVNASLPEARQLPVYMEHILTKISNAIDGQVILENDIFYVVKRDGRKIDFSLEAEGLRKLGLLWKLIRNGLLENGTILLWDEPEANLNPELFPLVVEILLELQRNGVQIFLATHSYNFAKYLEIRRSEKEQVQFHNLYRGTSELPQELREIFHSAMDQNNVIYSDSAYSMEELHPNHIMMADNKLLDEIYDL